MGWGRAASVTNVLEGLGGRAWPISCVQENELPIFPPPLLLAMAGFHKIKILRHLSLHWTLPQCSSSKTAHRTGCGHRKALRPPKSLSRYEIHPILHPQNDNALSPPVAPLTMNSRRMTWCPTSSPTRGVVTTLLPVPTTSPIRNDIDNVPRHSCPK